jgi:hypothetical protein
MQWHLDEISFQVTPGAHAILIVDRAGWHTTDKLITPPMQLRLDQSPDIMAVRRETVEHPFGTI